MICPKCNQEVSEGSKFCPNCGYSFESSKTKTTNKKPLIVVGIVAVFALVLVFAMSNTKGGKYDSAIKDINKGNYVSAIEKLESLDPSYQDTESYLTFAKACQLVDEKEFSEAIEVFESLGQFNDSDLMSVYTRGLYCFDANNLDKALPYFQQVPGFKNADDYIDYINVDKILRSNNYQDAEEGLQRLINNSNFDRETKTYFEDMLTLSQIDKLFNNNEKDECYSMATEIANNCDQSTELYKVANYFIQYIDGERALASNDKFTAYKCFDSCYRFKDATFRTAECTEARPKTSVLSKSSSCGKGVSVTIKNPKGSGDVYIKIYNAKDTLVQTVYIREGDSKSISFKAGKYRMAVGYGDGHFWFGKDVAFGSDGSYSRLILSGSSEYATFKSRYRYTIKLHVSSGGNVGNRGTSLSDF